LQGLKHCFLGGGEKLRKNGFKKACECNRRAGVPFRGGAQKKSFPGGFKSFYAGSAEIVRQRGEVLKGCKNE